MVIYTQHKMKKQTNNKIQQNKNQNESFALKKKKHFK